jgi:E3 SUMO-protein ligase PIAS1
MVNLVNVTSAIDLAARLKQTGSRIPRETVLRESAFLRYSHTYHTGLISTLVAVKAQDTDIVTTSAVMSLKDPISTMRISIPCRSNVCSHNQCFDGSYFLQLQEQAPTWTCPVCNKTLSYQSLCVDNYVQDILQNTSSSIDQVTIEPDGQWKAIDHGDDTNNRQKSQARAAYDNDSDDDIIEIEDTPKKAGTVDKIKTEHNSATPALAQQTPPVSREASTVVPRPSAKRPSTAVIDLTLSDDEDEPPRPAKRTNTSQNTSYITPASLQDSRFADLANRPFNGVGSGLPPMIPGDTLALPPIKPPQPNGGLPQDQRLPWPFGAPTGPAGYKDTQGYSNSPSRS